MQRHLIDGVAGWKLLPRGAEDDQREHGGAQGPQGEIKLANYNIIQVTAHPCSTYEGEAQLQRRDQDVNLCRQETRNVISFNLSKFDKREKSNIPNKLDYSGVALFRLKNKRP